MQTLQQTPTTADVTVQVVQYLDFAFAPWAWPFAERRGAEIQEFFRKLCEQKPTRRSLLHIALTQPSHY
jgi:hypothetical protein